MKKRIISSIILFLIALFLTGCTFTFDAHKHNFGKYYDNGDGTHTRTCLTDIEHKETSSHNYSNGTIIQQVDGLKCGRIKYTCKDCGYSKVEALYPEGNHTLDQKIVDEKYLYKKTSDYSSIYYLSCEHGVYGDESKLFEYNTLNDEYTLLDSVISDGSQYIDTGLSNDGTYYSSYTKDIAGTSSRLPSGYTELTYIESTGTQYIDTEIQDTVYTTVDCHFYIENAYNNYLFGSTQDNESYMNNGLYNNNSLEYDWTSIYFNPSNNIVLEEKLSGLNATITINGETTTLTRSTVSPTGNLYIFACNNGQRTYGEGLKCYYFKVYNNNTLIRDYIPSVNNSTLEVGLYDLVENKFYKSESEDNFIAGDIVQYNSQDDLPIGYTKVEYIESDGTQEIDTGILFNVDSGSIDLVYQSTQLEQAGMIVASEQSANHFWFYQYIANSCFDVYINSNNSQIRLGGITRDLGKHHMEYKNKTYYLDDESFESEDRTVGYTDKNLYIFSWHGAYFFTGRIYSLVIKEGNIVLRNFIPCIRESDSKAGLYDTVENRFYSSTIGNDFETGNVIHSNSSQTSLIDNRYQELEYIESTGTQYIDTGVDGSDDIGFEVTVSTNQTNDHVIIGQRGTQDGRQWCGYSNNSYYLGWNTNQYKQAELDTVTTISINYLNSREAKVDNEVLYTIHESLNYLSTYNVYIFSGNDSGISSFCGNLTLYSCKITDGDTLIRDYIPVYDQLTGTTGLYDNVSKNFFTSETESDFIAGNAVSSLIDNKYQELEYVEFTGTQYIDTKYAFNTIDKYPINIETKASIDDSTGINYTLAGCGDLRWIGPVMMNFCDNKKEFGSFGFSAFNEYTPNQVYTYNYYCDSDGSQIYKENNQSFGTSNKSISSSNVTLCIGAFNMSSGVIDVSYFSGKVYYFKLYSNDVLVRDFIPVKDIISGEIGLYDKVESKFYSNNGTGEFIAGPEIVYSSSYIGSINKSKVEYTLPNNYQELSSVTLESNNEIDTEVSISNTSRIELSFKLNDDKDISLLYINDFYNLKIVGKKLYLGSSPNPILDIELVKGINYKLVIGSNTSYTSDDLYNTIPLVYPMFVVTGDNSLKILDSTKDNGSITIYKLNIYEDGELTNSFIPSYSKLDQSNGLYDILNSKYIKSVDNKLIYKGINTNTSSYIDTEIDDITLPINYIKKDYIESDGKEFINTMIPYNKSRNLKFVYEVSYTNQATKNEFMGFDSSIWYFTGRNSSNQFVGTPNITLKKNRIYGVSFEINGSKAYYSFENKTYEKDITTILDKNCTFILFTTFDNMLDPTTYSTGCRIYSLKVYDNGCLINYFIPSTESITGINGLYDIINNNFIKSSTPYNLLSGYDDTRRVDDNNINLFYQLEKNQEYLKKTSISYLIIKDNTGRIVREYIPVIRNIDGKVGLLDLKNNKFYYSNTNSSLIRGDVLSHTLGDGVVIKNPTYSEEGLIEYTCSLCGTKIKEKVDKLSYKIDYILDNEIVVYTYDNSNFTNYENISSTYSRNIYSFNYSKVESCVFFKVETELEYNIICDSGDLVKLEDENTYILKNITKDTVIKIEKILNESLDN